MQRNLFGEVELAGISVTEAAERANVSSATVRNWIKTGYLTQLNKGSIDPESLSGFMAEIAGKEKLSARANKLKKDSHDHKRVSDLLQSKLSAKRSLDTLGEEYESSLSNSYRNQEGIYYTPVRIVKDMLKELKPDSSTTFCDPCCGAGNFIIEAINKGVKPEHIYAFDTDPNAIAITKKRILEKTGCDSPNVIEADFLQMASSHKLGNVRFDYIFTNPPWGKKLPKNEKERYGTIFQSGKSIDTCSLFFFACLTILNEKGELGFLLPEAFFNIATFQDARQKALALKMKRLIDYGKPFKGLVTKAQSLILEKTESTGEEEIVCQVENNSFSRKAASFSANPKKIINFWSDADNARVIEHIYMLPHSTLENRAKWGLGIVTGNNAKFCKRTPKEGYIPIYKGSDIQPNGLKKPSHYIPKDLSLYQQVAPPGLYEAEAKLIYRFISSRLVFYCDTEQRYILNSANLLLPGEETGIAPQQVCDLLNSRFMNWVFTNLFHTHKILRGDLEALPIHTGYFKDNTSFNEASFLEYLNIEKTNNGTYRIKE